MLRRAITQLAILGALGLCAYVADSQSATADRLTYTTFQRPSNWDIYLFQGSGQSPRRLTTDPALDYDPVVSPDGRWLVFCSERRGNPDLYVLDLQASGGEPRLLIDSDALEDQASFSADSRSLTFVSTFSGNTDIYLLPFEPDQTARMTDARNLTRHPAGDFRPAFSPDGRHIAFSSDREIAVRAVSSINRERSSDIYVLDLGTQGLQRLTDAPGWDGSAKWSADGRQIVFYSQRGTDLDGRLRQSKIWMMASNGLNQRVVTGGESVAVSPEFLPNSRIIYSRRTAAGRWEIASVEPDGSDARVESDPSSRDYRAPTKGPASGSFIVYSDGPVAADPAGGYRRSSGEETLFSGGPVLVSGAPFRKTLPDRQIEIFPLRYFAAVLHPDEDMLLHLGPPGPASGPGGAPELLVSRTDGTQQRSLTRFDETQTEPLGFSWSNDGQWVAFTRGGATVPGVTGFAATGGADLWKMRADGSELQNLTSDTPGYDGHPSFSGDGKKIVFRSERTGQSHIHVMDADGGNVRQLTDGAGRDLFPVFSPTSAQIAFASNRDSPTSGLYEIFLLELKEDGSPGDNASADE